MIRFERLQKFTRYRVLIAVLTLDLAIRAAASVAESNVTTDGATMAPEENQNQTCSVLLANNQSYGFLRQTFQSFATNLKMVVYFYVNTRKGNDVSSISISGPDTFAPDVWVWATNKGKNLLRMPLDYSIMSLGLLTISTYSINVTLDGGSADCLSAVPYDQAVHLIAKFIAENITENGTTVGLALEGPVVCRSTFAFSHRIFGDKGIGFKCCSPPSTPGGRYVCQTPYSTSWELVWYGPIILLCWIYAIVFIHFYRIYRYSTVKRQIRQLSGVEQTILEIKQDVVNRIVSVPDHLAIRITDPEELLALRERPGFLDVFGVARSHQVKITFVSRICITVILVTAYYTVNWALIDQYRIRMRNVVLNLNDTPTVYLNVIGHMGWLFCRRNLAIYYLAVLETIYTILIPLIVFVVYMFIVYKEDARNFADPDKSPAVPYGRAQQYILRFINSDCGRIFHVVCLILLLVYFLLVAGVFVAYVVYFFGLGIFANIETASPWIMPLIISINFIVTAFDPVYYHYSFYKDMFFGICLQSYKQLTIRRQKEIFLPRDLLETFYIPKSREIVYTHVLRVLWVLTFVVLLLLDILTLQYPYYHQIDSIASFLGVQVVFILPLLAQMVYNNNRYSSLQETIIRRDVTLFIKNYLKSNPSPFPTVSKDRQRNEGDDTNDDGGGEHEGAKGGDDEEEAENEDIEGELKGAGDGYHGEDVSQAIFTGGQRVLEMNGFKNPLKLIKM